MDLRNEIYVGAEGRKSLIDLQVPVKHNGQLIIFVHGYMGYKDWGCWPLVQKHFVERGYTFCKFNTSHNGCTVENPTEFTDLEAFSVNTYSKELEDLKAVRGWIKDKVQADWSTHLIGHSRGGAIVLLHEEEVASKTTWASISDIGARFPKGDTLQKWEEDGIRFQHNGRTKQDLPLAYTQYTHYLQNKDRLDIQHRLENQDENLLIIHGEKDTSVSPNCGKELATWSGKELKIIPNTQHTFDSKEPWSEEEMPDAMKKVCRFTEEFIAQHH